MSSLVEALHDSSFLLAVFAAVAVAATVITVALPLLDRDRLQQRMKSVSVERDKIRARERARLAAETARPALRSEPRAYMKQIVEALRLRQSLMNEATRDRLRMGGFRSEAHVIAFLFARLALPGIAFLVALFYLFVVLDLDQPAIVRLLMALGIGYVGFYLPNVYLTNCVQKRQTSIKRAFPDALDLLLICVEAGMSVEAAFRKVGEEVGLQSVPLAEEFLLTTAELSFLQDRRLAYENLAKRTGLDGVKAVTTALIQSERYGTPLGQSLRVMAQENRDIRMSEAEKKAAGLPPKLTVPMILFFLPVLFVVILGPAAIRLSNLH